MTRSDSNALAPTSPILSASATAVAAVLLLAGTWLLASAPAQAEMLPAALMPPSTLVVMNLDGTPNTTVKTDGRVVFRNGGTASTRIVFARKDADAFDCVADGDNVVRSRSMQLLLRGGAELACTVRPGRYRYRTLTQSRRGVHETRPTLSVRN
jgi:hypothetical protein